MRRWFALRWPECRAFRKATACKGSWDPSPTLLCKHSFFFLTPFLHSPSSRYPFPKEERDMPLGWWVDTGRHLTSEPKWRTGGWEVCCQPACGRRDEDRLVSRKLTPRKFWQIPLDIWNSSFYFIHTTHTHTHPSSNGNLAVRSMSQDKTCLSKETKVVLFHFPELCLAVFYFFQRCN